MLLTRDNFRKLVFDRDDNKCVICKKPAKDAHHIIERRLFKDGGYYLDNGASLCSDCHYEAEKTNISVEQIRTAANIKNKILPEHLYPDQLYDKWGNPILVSGQRMCGELFDDPSVQKILHDVLHLFTNYIKYPRTYHLPWSHGTTSDDRVLKTLDYFDNREIVVTLKMDGENTTMYNDYIHSRSLDGRKHWSKDWVKNFHSKISHDIPRNMRLVVENLYAKHSIHYQNLLSYVYGISIWENLICLDWDSTVEWFNLFDIPTVPVLYRGLWDEKKIKSIILDYNTQEGYVVRLADSFHYKNFWCSVAKYVRKNHITTDEHWFIGNSKEINDIISSK